MDNLPKITFINSPRTEEERLKFTRRIIGQGFYQKHGFVVLPAKDGRVDENAQVIYPKELIYQEISIDKWVREWEQVEAQFWQELEKYFHGVSEMVGELEVRITRYGTVSSNSQIGIREGRKEVFYLRHDVDLSHLAAMIINSVLYQERKGLGITWTKREALMDFIMTRPAMKKLFPSFRPVMSQLARVPATVRKESEAYICTLGVAVAQPEFEVKTGKIFVKGKQIGGELSVKEKVVLKQLIERVGELVTYDELADTVWGVGEFKTFWAINKLIERLRPKLTGLGIEGKRIEAVRGQGYTLR